MISGHVVRNECVAIECRNYVDILRYGSVLTYEFMIENFFKQFIIFIRVVHLRVWQS